MPNSQFTILTLLTGATLLPLLVALVVLLCGNRLLGRGSGWASFAGFAGSFAMSVAALLIWLSQVSPEASPAALNLGWIPIASQGPAQFIYLGAYADSLTLAMFCMITSIAMLVSLYSIGYMAGDSRFSRYFAFLSFFVFSMLGLVLSNTFVQVLLFWELVGIASYLLIGFWFEKKGPQVASLKAVLMNKISDVGLFIGIGILFHQMGGSLFLPLAGNDGLLPELNRIAMQGETSPAWLTLAGLFLFLGAMAKSAQFPLHTWLPDAMEGPTPVSSIIHSATMVGAGVYLTARISPMLTPAVHLCIIIIGMTTLITAGLMALVHNDIKRVLAYSTVSQLGLMMLGLGTGSFVFAIFHLITHAFFKCCLFQCAGSVITATHHVQDMRRMGGLAKKMPITMVCFLISSLALAGAAIPLAWMTGAGGPAYLGLSGFFSKHGVLESAIAYGQLVSPGFGWGWFIALAPIAASYLTAFYMARAFALVFLGKPRDQAAHEHAHEAPWLMWLPQVLLVSMCFLSVPGALPFFEMVKSAAPGQELAVDPTGTLAHTAHWFELFGLGWVIPFTLGLLIYSQGYKISRVLRELPVIYPLSLLLERKFFLDTLFDRLIVGLVRWLGRVSAVLDQSLLSAEIVSKPVTRLATIMRTTQAANPRVSIGITLCIVVVLIIVAGVVASMVGS